MAATKLAFAIIPAFLLAACGEAEQSAKPARPIRSIVVHGQNIAETISQTGEIRPRFETPLSFRLSGELRSRRNVGEHVAAGEIVALLDSVPARNDLASANAEADVTRSALLHAEQNAQRIQELYLRAVATRVQMQDAEASLRTARARHEAANSNVAKANESLTYTELKAPHDGIVAATSANAGQAVSAGQAVLSLVSSNQREAVFDVPESLIRTDDLGDPIVEVSLISSPSVRITGKVREIAPTSDASTRTYRVRVALEQGADVMPFGAAVVGRISGAARHLFPLPAAALTRAGDRPAVFVYNPKTRSLSVRHVKVERYEGERIIVEKGIQDGDIVAIAGVSKLRDGQAATLDEVTSR